MLENSAVFAENSRRRDCRVALVVARRTSIGGETRSLRNISRIHLIITVPPRTPIPPLLRRRDVDGSLVNISRLPLSFLRSSLATGHYPVREVIFDTGSYIQIGNQNAIPVRPSHKTAVPASAL